MPIQAETTLVGYKAALVLTDKDGREFEVANAITMDTVRGFPIISPTRVYDAVAAYRARYPSPTGRPVL